VGIAALSACCLSRNEVTNAAEIRRSASDLEIGSQSFKSRWVIIRVAFRLAPDPKSSCPITTIKVQ
jgi:hypothetical protein